MIGFSRRWLRHLTKAAVLLLFASGLLLVANKNRLIALEKYVHPVLVPEYFQPPSEAYVVDLAVHSCLRVNKNGASCGPTSKKGKYGELNAGNWTRVDKDLLLGLSWVWKTYILAKKIAPQLQELESLQVVVDAWVGIRSVDCAVAKNTQCIPKKVLEDIHTTRVFGDKEFAQLKAESKDIVGKVESDKDRTAMAYYEKYHQEKAQAAKEAEELKSGGAHAPAEHPEKSSENHEEIKEESKGSEDSPNDANDIANENSEQSAQQHEGQPGQDGVQKRDNLVKRGKETSRHDLQGYLLIPTAEELDASGWKNLGRGVWVKYGPASPSAITGVDVLFGPDAVEPRAGWTVLPHPIQVQGAREGLEPRLTIRRGREVDHTSKQFRPSLKFRSDGKFKILQVADLHFSTGVGKCRDPAPAETSDGCEADPRTLRFIEKVLDIEQPDFVVMSGDQVFGQAAPDPETALFKAVNPFVRRNIPYAITLGNHDDESGVLLREQMMKLAASLPYSLLAVGPAEVDGFGNYALKVEGGWTGSIGAALYFMDSHSYSKKPKTNPGYDWFKQNQLAWLELEALAMNYEAGKAAKNPLSMAFFHIPIPEFGEIAEKPMMGQMREGVASTRYKTDIRTALGNSGVQVVAVGHDHANDYCMLHLHDGDTLEEHKLWLCYGGGVGEGGYGGYGGYIRRLRLYELDLQAKTVRTWKRGENDPGALFDEQTVVEAGVVVEHV